jgi:hypothetical protein
MSSYDWGELRAGACDRFGDAPGAELERRILAVFTDHPAVVAAGIDSVAGGYAAGRIRSPWPMLATQVEREAERVVAAHSIVASGGADHEAKLAQAERYIRRVGYLHQSEQEIRDELASRRWPVDERLIEVWRSVRPLGEQVEREQLERAKRWRMGRTPMHELGSERTSDAHTTQTAQPSQTTTPLTRVSARIAAGVGIDADIAW